MKKLLSILTVFLPLLAAAQFAPPVGQIGSTAISGDSSIFIGWATECTVTRGYQDISDVTLGITTVGDSTFAIDKAGVNGVISLGDGGSAILTFNRPITNGVGWDFAVFENSFNDLFLELAYVEVSSDGINYVRFPAISNTQDTIQVNGFGELDATKINNFAGKYRGNYGTPFDLEELRNSPQLNIDSITHIKIVDVVGCVQSQYATRDSQGKIVNDPWPTPFPSGGFDLDAVGVIHQTPLSVNDLNYDQLISIYPNPTSDLLWIKNPTHATLVYIIQDITGKTIVKTKTAESTYHIDLQTIPNGIYFLTIKSSQQQTTKKFVISH